MSDSTPAVNPAPEGAAPEGEEVEHGKIVDVSLRQEMSRSYMDYAMAVLISRALPDVRDGLKPVQRRIVYGMYTGGYRPEKAYNKSSRIVGDVMGKFHPHGDTAIYDAMVRLAQPWSLSAPLVDGNGNFGSQGDDGAAASRYTEARMAPVAMDLVDGIDEESVEFKPNYDGRDREPVVLPARIPNLIVNGASGIAVGMATQIPPANLGEVADVLGWLLKNPDSSDDDLLAVIDERMPGPDFPTGALIAGRSGVREAYATGRGSIRMRAVINVETTNTGRTQLVVTELPYQVNKDALLRDIKNLVDTGRIAGIADLNDEGSIRAGMRLIITLKRDAIPKVVLNNLYKHTKLQSNFSANMVAIVNDRPQVVTMPDMMRAWVAHQEDVIANRTRFRLAKARDRQHFLAGLLAALDHLDQVIHTIRTSATTEESRQRLMELLGVDEGQANGILDMQLRRLAALEADKITSEHDALTVTCKELATLLADRDARLAVIGDELAGYASRHAKPRRTRIVGWEGDINDEDLIPEEDTVVTLTRGGYIKRTRAAAYRAQKRGGKGSRGATVRDSDTIDHLIVTTTHHTLYTFTDKGRVYKFKAHEIAEGGKDAKGSHIANVLGLAADENVAAVLPIKDADTDNTDLVLTTRDGMVKRTPLSAYQTRMSGGLIAVNLHDGDTLVGAHLLTPGQHLIAVSTHGRAARFDTSSLRSTGRNTAGVTAMRLPDDAKLLASAVIDADDPRTLLLVTSGGYGKRTPLDQYRTTARNTLGVNAMARDEGRGDIIAAAVVDDTDEVFALTSRATMLRTRIGDIRVTSRVTKGVRLIDLPRNTVLTGLAVHPADPDEGTAGDTTGEDATATTPTVEETPEQVTPDNQ